MATTAEPLTAEATRSDAWVQLRTGACDFAVRVADTLIAVPMPATGLTPLPRRQAGALSGVVDFRGSAVPVVALDRWLPLGEPIDPSLRRILVVRAGTSLLGIEVDAVAGVHSIDRASIRRIHGDSPEDPRDVEELFLEVAPAGGKGRGDRDKRDDHDRRVDRVGSMLCLLDIGRLATLALLWCDESQADPAPADQPGRSPGAANSRPKRRRCGVFEIGDELWAIDAQRLAKVAATPVLELKWPGRRTCGICEFEGRKIPVVDLAHHQPSAAPARPWLAVVEHEGQWLGLKVSRCQQFLDLDAEQVTLASSGEFSSTSAALPGLGTLRLLDVDKLFAAVPEAGISRSTTAAAATTTTGPNRNSAATARTTSAENTSTAAATRAADPPSHYIVFDADRRYASPVAGVVGVIELSAPTIDELDAGRRATVAWRGKTLSVVNMPPLNGAPSEPLQPRLAVILEGATENHPCTGIAIRSLSDWLPAQAAAQRGLRMNSMGDLSMITSQRHSKSASLVVVDLAQMAYLLS